MAHAHELDYESGEGDCRFVVQSEDEAIEFAKNHMKEVHGKELTNDDFQEQRLQQV